MQIVIDIDDEVYKEIKEGLYDKNVRKMAIAIGNSTPLSKGHGRLIDVSEYFKKEFGDAREFLNKATTIIEAESEEV